MKLSLPSQSSLDPSRTIPQAFHIYPDSQQLPRIMGKETVNLNPLSPKAGNTHMGSFMTDPSLGTSAKNRDHPLEPFSDADNPSTSRLRILVMLDRVANGPVQEILQMSQFWVKMPPL